MTNLKSLTVHVPKYEFDMLSDKLENKKLRVEMPDESKWEVPVYYIALSRADYYVGEFSGDILESLKEDTIPLFENNHYEIEDWAQNNMYWSDVLEYAKQSDLPEVDYEEGWMNGAREIV